MDFSLQTAIDSLGARAGVPFAIALPGVCRKLRLARGDSFADIGCGFGGFMFRALETTGACGVRRA